MASSRDIREGVELPVLTMTSSLATSVRYAGASGDLNPLHYDAEFAAGVSPTGGIIAHGMFSMGLASRALTAFAGGPEHVREVQVRFTRPWRLGDTVTFGGKVTEISEGQATISLWADDAQGTRILRGTGRITL